MTGAARLVLVAATLLAGAGMLAVAAGELRSRADRGVTRPGPDAVAVLTPAVGLAWLLWWTWSVVA